MAALALVACNKKTANLADNALKVVCNPEILEVVDGNIDADFTITYPAGYNGKDELIVAVPVLVYEGGEFNCDPRIYQGERVKQNYKVISSKGGTIQEKISIPYLPGMEKAHLELRPKAVIGAKTLDLPAIKIADGTRVTSGLADKKGFYDYKKDNYKLTYIEKAEGQIHYNVNSAELGNQLNTRSIENYLFLLADRSESGSYTIKDTKIISYASPEGGEEYNAKLSDRRSNTAEKAWNKIAKKYKNEDFEVVSVGQDWEGFQEAVAQSNIEDKELILRVLSMYSDPAVRESEIKNMSQIYTEIKSDVFPELRRSRFVTEIEGKNYTEADLMRLFDRKLLYLVDEEGCLRIAALSDSLGTKQMLYNALATRFGSQRGLFNLGVTYLEEGKTALADQCFTQMKDQEDPDVVNARGVVAMREGRYDDAIKLFLHADNDEAKRNIGVVSLLRNDYAKAAKQLEGTGGYNEAVADIYTGKYSEAKLALEGYDDARADYLRAIAAARQGRNSDARMYLSSAFEKDPSFKERAAKDIEFAALGN